MAGYASRTKPAEGKVHDLRAKALCLEDAGGKRLVLVTTDLIGIPRSLGDAVASEAEKKYGLKRDEQLGTLAQVPITGGSPREIRKDVLVADWSPDGQSS